jgi:hypothetical protein
MESELGLKPLMFAVSAKKAAKAKRAVRSELQLPDDALLNDHPDAIRLYALLSSLLLSSLSSFSSPSSLSLTHCFVSLSENKDWQESRFSELQSYILEQLDQQERARLKLQSPIGVARRLLLFFFFSLLYNVGFVSLIGYTCTHAR